MKHFHQAIALGIAVIATLTLSNKPGFSQTHGGHHSAPTPTAIPETSPTDRQAEVYVNQGLNKLHKKDYKGAIASFIQAVAIQPKHYIAYTYRGDIHRLTGDYQGAIEDYTQAIAQNSAHSYLHNSRGISYAALGEYQKAVADHTQAIEIYPEEGAGYRHRGAMYFKLGENEKALEDLEQAIARNENDAEAYTYRGEVQAKLGNKQSAIADYEKAAKLFATQSNKVGYNKATNLAKALQQSTPTASTTNKRSKY